MLRNLWIIFGVLLLLCSRSMAALPAFTDSIEVRVATADTVIIGHTIGVEKEIPPGGTITGPWWKVTVRVDEALVDAKPAQDIVFWAEDDGYSKFVAENTEKLILLVKGDLYAKASSLYAKIPLTLQKIGFLSDVEVPTELSDTALREIPNMTLRPFENRDQLMTAIRPYCARPLSLVHAEPISLKPPLWGLHVLFVPVDAQSETVAQRWIQSNDPEMRWNGVRVLRWMKSVKNVKLFQATTKLSPTSDANESTREMAILTLDKWGVPVARTTRFETASWNEMLGAQFWMSLLVIIAVPAVFWKSSKRPKLRRGPKVFRASTLGWVVLVTMIAVLWGRSYFELDGGCGGTWQIGAINGEALAVQCVRREGNVDWPWECCRASALWQTCSVAGGRWYFDWREPQWYFRDACGLSSWLEDTRSGPAFVSVVHVPFWLLEGLLGLLAVGVQGVRRMWGWFRTRRSRHRGFPVKMAGSANDHS